MPGANPRLAGSARRPQEAICLHATLSNVWAAILQTGRHAAGRTALGCLAVFAVALVALLLRADYTVFAVIGVFLFYALKDMDPFFRALGGAGFLSVTRTMGYYCATGLSLFPLLLYNGKRGRGLKWLFYAFYPGHLLLLYALKALLT